MIALALFASIAGRAPAAACADPEALAGLGPACVVPGGFEVVLGDGSTLFTHGGDPAPSELEAVPAEAAVPAEPACVSARRTSYYGVAVYARSADGTDNYAARATDIRSMIASANGMLRQEAAEFGRALDYRMLCDAGAQVIVLEAVLPTPFASTNFSSVVTDLRVLGFTSRIEKYWVWFDGHPPGTPGGNGNIYSDDDPSAYNQNNEGPSYGVTWGFLGSGGSRIMMHENGHNLGAVQIAAPESSGGFHCNDGLDVMCYADGGPFSNYRSNICSTTHFDCNHDSYFHPDPPEGHVLKIMWNLGSPQNRFLQGCFSAVGTLTLGAGGADIEGISARTHAVTPSCTGRPYSLSGLSSVFQDERDVVTGSVNNLASYADLDVCWLNGTTTLRCDAGDGAEAGVIPGDATSARVRLSLGTNILYILSAV